MFEQIFYLWEFSINSSVTFSFTLSNEAMKQNSKDVVSEVAAKLHKIYCKHIAKNNCTSVVFDWLLSCLNLVCVKPASSARFMVSVMIYTLLCVCMMVLSRFEFQCFLNCGFFVENAQTLGNWLIFSALVGSTCLLL